MKEKGRPASVLIEGLGGWFQWGETRKMKLLSPGVLGTGEGVGRQFSITSYSSARPKLGEASPPSDDQEKSLLGISLPSPLAEQDRKAGADH